MFYKLKARPSTSEKSYLTVKLALWLCSLKYACTCFLIFNSNFLPRLSLPWLIFKFALEASAQGEAYPWQQYRFRPQDGERGQRKSVALPAGLRR